MKHTLAIAGICALSFGCAQTPASSSCPDAGDAKAFLDNANETTLKLGIEQGQAGWVQQTFITDDTEALAARANQALHRGRSRSSRKEATRFDNVEVPADERRQLNLLKLVARAGHAVRSEGGRRADEDHGAARVDLRQGQVVRRPGEARHLHEHRRRHEDHGDAARREDAARRRGKAGTRSRRRCARTTRASSSCRTRARGARLRRHRRDVALEVRHAARRVREGARSAVGPGAAALPTLHAYVRAEAAREVRRRRAGERPDPGAPARQHLGAGLGRTSIRWSRRRTPIPATRLDRRS